MNLRSTLLISGAILATGVLVAQGQVPGINSTLNSVFTLAYDQSTMKPTFSATHQFVPSQAATDICSLTGSATKTIKVRRVIFSGIGSAVANDPVAVIKRSTANVGNGWTMVQTPYDSTNTLTNAAQTAGTAALAEAWTGLPTLGTVIGTLADLYYTWGNLTTGVGSVPLVFTFGQLGSPLVLRGVAQQVSINLGGFAPVTPLANCTFEWTEE